MIGRIRKYEWRLEDNLTPSNLPSTPCHPTHCAGASQVEEIPLGSSKSRRFIQDLFPGTHLLCRGGRPAASLAVLGSPRLFLKNPYSWTEKPRACISSCLMFPTCKKENEPKKLKAVLTRLETPSLPSSRPPGQMLTWAAMGRSSLASCWQWEAWARVALLC